jgi:hypothetical protein
MSAGVCDLLVRSYERGSDSADWELTCQILPKMMLPVGHTLKIINPPKIFFRYNLDRYGLI